MKSEAKSNTPSSASSSAPPPGEAASPPALIMIGGFNVMIVDDDDYYDLPDLIDLPDPIEVPVPLLLYLNDLSEGPLDRNLSEGRQLLHYFYAFTIKEEQARGVVHQHHWAYRCAERDSR